MTQEELKTQAESDKADATDLLCREFGIPTDSTSTDSTSISIANIVNYIVSASVAETLAEIKKGGENG